MNPSEISSALGGPSQLLASRQRLSSLCTFLADSDDLVVVANGTLKVSDADLPLAWGLAYAGDRRLTVALPRGREEATMLRAPWFDPRPRVVTFGDGSVSKPPPLTRQQSIAAYRRGRAVSRAVSLGDKASWIAGVLDWAANAPGVEVQELTSYLALHVAGRQVLKAEPRRNSLAVVAGVNYSKPQPGQEPYKIILTEPADQATIHRVVAHAARAAADRLVGADSSHREHRMQAALEPGALGLRAQWHREFPSWRPGATTATFIDFLGSDARRRPHVVETKIGPDALLILQGLDYWLWCRAHPDRLEDLDMDGSQAPMIDFVVAPKAPGEDLISIYTAAQAEALCREVSWRFVEVGDPDTGQPVTVLPPYELPSHRRTDTPARWKVRLNASGRAAAEESQSKMRSGDSFADPKDGLLEPAHAAYELLRSAGALHSHVGHVRSSQAFALNLLAPLAATQWTELLAVVLNDATAELVEGPQFEFSDPEDALAERTRASNHATQVDCLVYARTRSTARHAVLIEVKLSEDSFGTCSAYESERNDRREVCAQPGAFGNAPDRCFQLANHDREHKRRYDAFLGELPTSPTGFGCWFRDGANQVMRNTALARALIERSEAEAATIVLVAPDDHRVIWADWTDHCRSLEWVANVRFASMPATTVVALQERSNAPTLATRYLLSAPSVMMKHAQFRLDRRFPDGCMMHRHEVNGSLRYSQPLERVTVISAAGSGVTIETPYPAGPMRHELTWEAVESEEALRVTEPSGDGYGVFTAPDGAMSDAERGELSAAAHRDRAVSPWYDPAPEST